MKRVILITLSVLLMGSGFFLLLTFFNVRAKGEGALQVTASVKSQVFLNGKLLGTTPLCKCNQGDTVKEGEYTVNLVPDDKTHAPFSAKVKIAKGTLTAVDRTFLPGSLASAYILTLEKMSDSKPQLLVVSLPEGALVTIDGNPQGITPYLSKTISDSEHEIELQKQGFNKKTLRIRTIPSYKLVAHIILGTEGTVEEINPSTTITPTPPATSPTPSESAATVTIGSTPTGFLRVRSTPSLSGSEIARVEPGEKYPLLEEQSGWYKIQLQDQQEGWISSTYAERSP